MVDYIKKSDKNFAVYDTDNTRNLTRGEACLPWSDTQRGWVAVDGSIIRKRSDAEEYAEKVNRFISLNSCK